MCVEGWMRHVNEPARQTPIVADADVVVVGGGPAGTGAAIRAAREGASVIIVDRWGAFGGFQTMGFMYISKAGPHVRGICKELFDSLKTGGYIADITRRYPAVMSLPLVHYGRSKEQWVSYDPDMTSFQITNMMEHAGVRIMLHSLFVDAIIEDGVLRAVIVENASGRQAIEGKVVVDATGRGDVVARSGAPFVSAKHEMGLPVPGGLQWRMFGVDFERLSEYLENEDPGLAGAISEAETKGELPYYRKKKTVEEMSGSGHCTYTGHPAPELCPTLYPNEALFWAPIVHDWGLDPAQNAEDLTRAVIQIKKEIVSELTFLKKRVPGFENARLAGIAPMYGIREGRHPVGEYVLTKEDAQSGRRFDDAVATFFTSRRWNLTAGGPRPPLLQYEIPYRSLLPKKLGNLLLTGDVISADTYMAKMAFAPAMALGEAAGVAAALSVESGVVPKELKWPGPLRWSQTGFSCEE
jgi:hypothetical protein